MDRALASRFGYEAIELLMAGEFGKLVVWKDGTVGNVAIASVAGQQRKVPVDHPLVRTARAVGTRFGD